MQRRGLSLVEVLIAVVLLGLVGAGITRLLQSQMRYFTRSTNARDARAVPRAALNIMGSELRMIEPNGITLLTDDSLQARVPYAMGVFCAASTVTFAPVDSLTWANAVNGGYAWRDTVPGAAYTYVANTGTNPVAGLSTTCTAVGITPIAGGPLVTLTPAVPLTTVGAPVFLYQNVTYYFGDSALEPGRTALWRRVGTATPEEIAVPFDNTSRFRFFETGNTTAQDAVPASLNLTAGIELVLRGESERSSPGINAPEQSETRVAIFFRNAVQ